MRRFRTIGMGILIFGVLVFSSQHAPAQTSGWRSRIDQVIATADSLSMLSQYTFHLNKFDRKDRRISEAWYYTLNNDKVAIFEVHFFIDSLEQQEVYYLDDGELVCMEEYEILYPKDEEDRIIWGSVGFFERQSLVQHTTLGNPGYPLQPFQQWEVFKKFRSRYKELEENRTLMERKNKGAIFAP